MRCAWMTAVLVVAGMAVAQTPATQMVHKMVAPDQVKWGKAPPGLPPGIESAIIEGDPAQPGTFVLRVRLPGGTQIKPHWHTKDEHVTVLSGAFAMGMGDKWSAAALKELPAGGYMSMPAGQHHFAQANGDTVLQLHGSGPWDINYVNASDDPRTKRSSR